MVKLSTPCLISNEAGLKLFIEPSLKKLDKILAKYFGPDQTLLHHTGAMYGIGCRLSSETAINRIARHKARVDKTGFIVLVPDFEWFEQMDEHIPLRLKPLLEQYMPGNLSVAWTVHNHLTDHVSKNGKVAFRIPSDPLLRACIDAIHEPIISTSINRSNLPPEEDLDKIKTAYEAWFDLGILPHKKRISSSSSPSTLIEYISSGEPGNLSGVDEIRCLREGSIPFYEIRDAFSQPTIMFVCTANICRSPIAEKLFNHMVQSQGLKFRGDSCGLLDGGHEISLNSMQLLLEKGITEAQEHVSKQYTQPMLSGSRLILTMEERQRDYLRDKEPDMAHKILTLNELVGEEGDIKDPFRTDLDNYRKTYQIIEQRLTTLIDMLKHHKIELT